MDTIMELKEMEKEEAAELEPTSPVFTKTPPEDAAAPFTPTLLD